MNTSILKSCKSNLKIEKDNLVNVFYIVDYSDSKSPRIIRSCHSYSLSLRIVQSIVKYKILVKANVLVDQNTIEDLVLNYDKLSMIAEMYRKYVKGIRNKVKSSKELA